MNAEQGNIQTCTFMTLHVYLGLLMSEMCHFQSHLKKKNVGIINNPSSQRLRNVSTACL